MSSRCRGDPDWRYDYDSLLSFFFCASPRFWYATYAESFFSYMLDRFMPFLVSNIVDNVGVG